MKDIQATREAAIPQKRTSSTSKQHISSLFLLVVQESVDLLLDTVKGTVSRDGYFFEGLNILISFFCLLADDFQGLSNTFHHSLHN
jgi:hypothetical protein